MSGIYESEEVIGAFLDEVDEQLQFLEEGILELEKEETPEVIQKIFRVAHTLKGSSASMGYDKMKNLTHEMENVFDKIRNNLLKVNMTIINSLFKCLDSLRLLKEDFLVNRNETKISTSEIVKELKDILENETGRNSEKINKVEVEQENHKQADIQADELFSIGDIDGSILESLDDSDFIICQIRLSQDSFMKATRAFLIMNSLNQVGTVVASSPNVLELSDDSDISTVSYLLNTKLGVRELKKKAKDEFMDVDEVKVSRYKNKLSLVKKQNLINEVKQDSAVEIKQDMESIIGKEENSTKKISKDSDKSASHTVRVDIERLEQMMNLVGEMVIEQTRINQVGNILHNRYAQDNIVEDLIGISNHVNRVVSELQESVMKARMLPIQQIFNRLPRIIRDLSQSLNKEVELILEGGETEMDRTIIEDITDPLIHIVRNSLDHGIENEEDRKKNNKPRKGLIKIRAFHQENHVIITIEDDGAGLDLDKIKNSAIKKNVISAQTAEHLTKSEIINLIFETGLSTADNISDISGRGVGMDIVRNHIDKLNGIIDVETKKNEGTKFTIKPPLTLAILSGLLVKVQEETYALPMSNIIEIVRKPIYEIESVNKQSVVTIRDKIHPLIWLHDYFNLPRKKQKKNVFIVVLGTAEKRFGIVVDKLVGNQEIVVKPLGSYIGKVEGISGATILGDGSVACIFDVVGLSRMIINRVTKENIISNSEQENDVRKFNTNEIMGET